MYRHLWPYVLILTLFLLPACKKDEPKPVSSGTFVYKGEKYNVSMVRVEHTDYDNDGNFVLRLTAYPGTYKVTDKSSSGYGNVLDIYYTAGDNDFGPGKYSTSKTDTLVSTLTYYPNISDDKAAHDTVVHTVSNGTLEVGNTEVDGFLTYSFRLADADGDSIIGSYTGTHVHNRIAVQPSYGQLSFDTIRCALARPYMIRWGKVFSNINYTEIVFYSADARFTDAGALSGGIQFSVGILTDSASSDITSGSYPVIMEYYTSGTVLYGHKVRNTAWGTYWQTMYNGASTGKANVLGGTATVTMVTDDMLTAEFRFTDQLNNSVEASYSGPYMTKNNLLGDK